MDVIWHSLTSLLTRGGIVMWPLLGLLIWGLTLCFERAWFWAITNRPGRLKRVIELSRLLREGEYETAQKQTASDLTVYGRVGTALSTRKPANGTKPVAHIGLTEVVESQRARLERFMPTLSTIITAAPMLGILGTVLGIISSFRLLSGEGGADPSQVGQGIAEALLTTAVGLVVALVILFPYNAFRAQLDRTIGRLEMLAESAEQGDELHSQQAEAA